MLASGCKAKDYDSKSDPGLKYSCPEEEFFNMRYIKDEYASEYSSNESRDEVLNNSFPGCNPLNEVLEEDGVYKRRQLYEWIDECEH